MMRSRDSGRRSAGGASIVELMIAIALGMMVLTGVLLIFSNTRETRAEIERVSDRLENGRYALEVLGQDLQTASFYGEFQPTGALVFPLPDACSVDPLTWEAAMLLPVQGFNSVTGYPSCLPASRMAGSDAITVRRARGCLAGAAGCDPVTPGEPYLQVSMCTGSPQRYVLAVSGSDPFALTEKDCATPAAVRRYVVNTYFVSTDNGAGVSVPTLKKLELENGAFREVALAEGVERLAFEYGIDTDNDGSADRFTSDVDNFTYAGCGTCSPAANWSSVMAVRVYVLVRALAPSGGYIDTRTYTLGRDAAGNTVSVGPFNDAYRRSVYTTVVRLMNPSTRRETP
ncbi:MAG TPA: PilW family protein [Burkholderiales bacterium]|nr:PilW family protein [Burkholderiales bacterium]